VAQVKDPVQKLLSEILCYMFHQICKMVSGVRTCRIHAQESGTSTSLYWHDHNLFKTGL